MSFIYGIIDFNGSGVQKAELNALAKAVQWENFEEHGELSDTAGIGFCHYKDRNPKAGIYQDHELLVLADIRIYNGDRLKKIIDFSTPAEAVANAYWRWGIECPDHIHGDFAAMVYDKKNNEVHLFRDHIGVRPLAYWFSGNRLVFASHEFGLAKSGQVKTSFNEEKLLEEFFGIRGSYDETAFRDIFKIIPGYTISFSLNKKTSFKFWKPEDIKQNFSLSYDAAVSRLRQFMITATRNRMEPIRTAVHVSGGIDSTGVASIMADHFADKTQLTGYSWTPGDYDAEVQGVNEKEYIEAFVKEKEVAVKYLIIGENQTYKDVVVPEFEVQYVEHPVMKMALADHVHSVFTGWGGDEFVSLNMRGTVNHLFFNFKWRSLARYAAKKSIKSLIGQLRIEVLPLFVPFLPVYRLQYFQWSKLRLLKPSFILKYWRLIFVHKRKNIFGYGNRTRFMLNLLEIYHLSRRMDSWAINGERYGIEYKYPLVDKDLLEFWFSIPVAYTYRDFVPRKLYKDAMKGILPEKIRIRNDKADPLFIDYRTKKRLSEEKFLSKLFDDLKEQDHIPGFRPEMFKKVFSSNPAGNVTKSMMEQGKVMTYLHYAALRKKYFPMDQDFTKTR